MTDVLSIGDVEWHCSEEGGGPDVGLCLILSEGWSLWAGEITRKRWREAGEDAAALGADTGWWIILFGPEEASHRVIAKCVDRDVAMAMVDALEIGFRTNAKNTADENAALREAASWRPIDTAPKDGTLILGGKVGFVPFFCYWRDEKGGQWFSDHASGYWHDGVTHWMPVPESPNPENEGSAGE